MNKKILLLLLLIQSFFIKANFLETIKYFFWVLHKTCIEFHITTFGAVPDDELEELHIQTKSKYKINYNKSNMKTIPPAA